MGSVFGRSEAIAIIQLAWAARFPGKVQRVRGPDGAGEWCRGVLAVARGRGCGRNDPSQSMTRSSMNVVN
jgi:hypothetical protein